MSIRVTTRSAVAVGEDANSGSNFDRKHYERHSIYRVS